MSSLSNLLKLSQRIPRDGGQDLHCIWIVGMLLVWPCRFVGRSQGQLSNMYKARVFLVGHPEKSVICAIGPHQG